MTELKWVKGQTFSQYIKKNKISLEFLKRISKDDQKFLSDIDDMSHFYELRDNSKKLLQVLIPISEEMQIQLIKMKGKSQYDFDIIPIKYEKSQYYAKVFIKNNPYRDILRTTKNKNLARRLSSVIKDVVKSNNFRKNDEINVLYEQKTRMGNPYVIPDIKIVRLVMKGKIKFIYVDSDGHGHANIGKSIVYKEKGKKKVVYTKKVRENTKNTRFIMPLRHVRITSSFSYRRWHPILRRYRPHHGTDFGARRGTPLKAVNSGRISFSGWMGGYGKVVKIKHADGYESLYAHQSRIRVKKGQKVKRGQIIGYVGNTGRSTGPHLHFGLKKNGRWVNPMKVLKKVSIKRLINKKFTSYKDIMVTKYKTVFIKNAKKNKVKLSRYIRNKKSTYIWNK